VPPRCVRCFWGSFAGNYLYRSETPAVHGGARQAVTRKPAFDQPAAPQPQGTVALVLSQGTPWPRRALPQLVALPLVVTRSFKVPSRPAGPTSASNEVLGSRLDRPARRLPRAVRLSREGQQGWRAQAVFGLDRHQCPLMACTEKRARLLLARGRSSIDWRPTPFGSKTGWRTLAPFSRRRAGVDQGLRTSGLALARKEASEAGPVHHALYRVPLAHRGTQVHTSLLQRAPIAAGGEPLTGAPGRRAGPAVTMGGPGAAIAREPGRQCPVLGGAFPAPGPAGSHRDGAGGR
jgi:hypothetical protein